MSVRCISWRRGRCPPATLAAFLVATLALLLIPGPSVLFAVARSVAQGRRAGLASVGGGALGNLVHVCAATVGLSALLASSALAFSVVKYLDLGAAYLLYLSLRTLLTTEAAATHGLGPHRSLRRIFSQGVAVYALNPKAAPFFLAFLPQFTDPARGPLAPQPLAFGALFVLLAPMTDSAYALLAGAVGGWLRKDARGRRGPRYVSSGVYLALGVTAAVSGQRK